MLLKYVANMLVKHKAWLVDTHQHKINHCNGHTPPFTFDNCLHPIVPLVADSGMADFVMDEPLLTVTCDWGEDVFF